MSDETPETPAAAAAWFAFGFIALAFAVGYTWGAAAGWWIAVAVCFGMGLMAVRP